MTPGESRGFLLVAPDSGGPQVLSRPETYADANSTALSVSVAGQAAPITVLLVSPSEDTLPVRRKQAQALAQRVQRLLAQDASVIVLGTSAVNGLFDLTGRAERPASMRGVRLPSERVLVSPALLRQFGRAHVEFPRVPTTDPIAQLLKLQQ